MIDSIIFDLDGTLWDSREGIVEAWNGAVEAMGIAPTVTVENLTPCMGLPLDEIAERLFPGNSREKREKIIESCITYQSNLLNKKGGKLYPGLIETLKTLKRDYRLFIVSNCQIGYIESFLGFHKTGELFEDFENNGRTGLLKAENISLIIDRNALKAPVYVGDTETDRQAAEKAGIPFIFASYGFGTVKKEAAAVLAEFSAFPKILRNS